MSGDRLLNTVQNGTRIWRYGVFEVDAHSLALRRNGIPVRIREQSFRVLLYLMEHAGELVSREDLRRVLWPADTFVDFDHSLNTAMIKLSDALGDVADAPVYMESIPKRGYRFIARLPNRLNPSLRHHNLRRRFLLCPWMTPRPQRCIRLRTSILCSALSTEDGGWKIAQLRLPNFVQNPQKLNDYQWPAVVQFL